MNVWYFSYYSTKIFTHLKAIKLFWLSGSVKLNLWGCCSKSMYNFCINMEFMLMMLRFRTLFNTLGPRQNGRHFPNDISLNENVWISNKISLKFIPKGPINNIPALVQIMAQRRPGDKPLSAPMMVSLLTHICVTGTQWVKVCLIICLLILLHFQEMKNFVLTL